MAENKKDLLSADRGPMKRSHICAGTETRDAIASRRVHSVRRPEFRDGPVRLRLRGTGCATYSRGTADPILARGDSAGRLTGPGGPGGGPERGTPS